MDRKTAYHIYKVSGAVSLTPVMCQNALLRNCLAMGFSILVIVYKIYKLILFVSFPASWVSHSFQFD